MPDRSIIRVTQALLGLSLLSQLLGCSSPPPNDEQTPNREASADELPDDELVSAYRRVCEVAGMTLKQEDPPVIGSRSDSELWRAACVSSSAAEIWFDVHTGEVRLLRSEQARSKPHSGRWDAKPLTEEQAREAVATWMQKLRPWCLDHVEASVEEVSLMCLDRSQVSPSWIASFTKSHRGFEVRGWACVEVLDDGTLVKFDNLLPRVDCPTEIKVTESDARNAALEALVRVDSLYCDGMAEAREFFGDIRSGARSFAAKVPLRIVTATPLLEDRDKYEQSLLRAQPSRLRLAYVFQYQHADPVDRENSSVILYIDAQTGDCIGGHVLGS